MKTILKKLFAILCMLVVLVAVYPNLQLSVLAAETATVSISNKSADVGDKVSVTITASSNSKIMMCDLYIKYDPHILEAESGYDNGGGGKIRILSTDATSFTVSFKALAAGTSSVSLDTGVSIIASEREDRLSISGGKGSVKVSAPGSYSSNNSLKSLSISPGTLSPAFSSNVTSYTASVDEDCTKLAVSALAEDSSATVSVTGTRMDPGMNTTKITVKAQNGSTKVYTIKTTRGGSESTTKSTEEVSQEESQTDSEQETVQPDDSAETVVVNGEQYNIVNDFTNHILPTGYTQDNMNLYGKQITVGKSVSGITIMYLEKADGNGEGGFYIYDATTDTFTLFTSISQPVLLYTVLPITDSMELPEGYTKTTLDINGTTADVLVKDPSNPQYCLFYGSSSDGEVSWYRYDYKEKTVQRYIAEDIAQSQNSMHSLLNIWQNGGRLYMIIAAVVVAVLLLTVIIQGIILMKKNKKLKVSASENTDGYDDEQYYDGDYNYYEDVLADESDDTPPEEDTETHKEETSDISEGSEMQKASSIDSNAAATIVSDQNDKDIEGDILEDEDIIEDVLEDEDISEDILEDEADAKDLIPQGENTEAEEISTTDIPQEDFEDSSQQEMEYIQNILKTDVLTDFEDHTDLFKTADLIQEDHNEADKEESKEENKDEKVNLDSSPKAKTDVESIEIELIEIEDEKHQH